tara:strand:+ start:505 stop:705 length:201 start_codon:yes stop_codon:yes gene_type:complete
MNTETTTPLHLHIMTKLLEQQAASSAEMHQCLQGLYFSLRDSQPKMSATALQAMESARDILDRYEW